MNPPSGESSPERENRARHSPSQQAAGSTSDPAAPSIFAGREAKNKRAKLFASYPWLIYVFPFAVFALVTQFEPTPAAAEATGWTLPYSAYPLVYTVKIVLTALAVALVWPGYRTFPWRLTPWSFLVGAVGVVVWVALCHL